MYVNMHFWSNQKNSDVTIGKSIDFHIIKKTRTHENEQNDKKHLTKKDFILKDLKTKIPFQPHTKPFECHNKPLQAHLVIQIAQLFP